MARRNQNTAINAINEIIIEAPVMKISKSKKAKTDTKEKIEFSSDFETLVNVAIVDKALKGVKESLAGEFEDFAFEIFQERLAESGKKPDEFTAVHGEASANYRLQKPGYGFSQEAADFLDEHKIEYDVEEKEPERIIVNPELLKNQELLEKFAMAIKELKFDVPVFMKIPATNKYTPNEKTYEGISKLESEDQKRILQQVTNLYFTNQNLDGCDYKDQSIVNKALANLANTGILRWNPEIKKSQEKKAK